MLVMCVIIQYKCLVSVAEHQWGACQLGKLQTLGELVG